MLVFLVLILSSPANAEAPIVVEAKRGIVSSNTRDQTLPTERIEPDKLSKGVTSAGVVLDQALGVRVQRSGSIGRAEQIQLRGAGGHQVGVFLEGIPIHSSRGSAVDLSTLPILALDHLAVSRGAASAAYGSGALGGVVDLRLIDPKDERAVAHGRMGSLGLAQFDGGLSTPLLSGGLNGAIHLERGDGEFEFQDINGIERRRENNGHEKIGGLLYGRWQTGSSTRVGLLLEGVSDLRQEPGPEQFPALMASSIRNRRMVGLHVDAPGMLLGRVSATTTAWHVQRNYKFRNPEPAFGGDLRTFAMEDNRSGVRVTSAWEGWSHHRPELVLEGHFETAVTRGEEERREARMSGAVTGAWSIYPHERIAILTMSRLDDAEGRQPVWVPKIGFRYEPTQQFDLRGNVGKIFRDPSFDELFFKGIGLSGNPELRHETGWGADLGLAFRPARLGLGNLQLNSTFFWQDYARLILFVPIDAYRIQARDDFGAIVFGLENGIRWEVASLAFKGSHLYQEPYFKTPDEGPLPLRPRHRFWGDLSIRVSSFELFGDVVYQASVKSDRYGVRNLPSYSLCGLGVAARANAFRLSFEARNIFNRLGLYDAVQQPLPGRTLLAQLSWTP